MGPVACFCQVEKWRPFVTSMHASYLRKSIQFPEKHVGALVFLVDHVHSIYTEELTQSST